MLVVEVIIAVQLIISRWLVNYSCLQNTDKRLAHTVRVVNFEGFKFSWISWLLTIHENKP